MTVTRPAQTDMSDTTYLIDQAIEDRYFRAAMHYPQLLKITVDQLTEQNFSTAPKAKLFRVLKQYYETFGDCPSLDILKITAEEMFPGDSASLITRVADKIHASHQVPEWKWIVSKIDRYIKTIRLRKALYEAAHLLDADGFTEAQDKLVDVIRHSSIITSTSSNDLALTKDDLFKLATDDDAFCCATRIYALDTALRGFYRKELFILMAPTNVGKSWFITHSAVSGLISGKRVLYFTLEMSRERALQRILQNISGTVKPRFDDELSRNVKNWDENWVEKEDYQARSLLDTNKVSGHLQTLGKFGGQLSVKEFASGEATIRDLEREIELFDVTFGGLPDMILVDGLLDIRHAGSSDPTKQRHGLTGLTRDLRRMAKDYNAAVILTHQSNRDSFDAEVVETQHTGESIGIMQVADTGISLNQTKAENKIGKARLNIMRARNMKKWSQIEIWQNLDIGQFCQASKELEMKQQEDEGDKKEYNRRGSQGGERRYRRPVES